MKVAELFVTLGIVGAEKTIGALSNVKRGLGDIAHEAIVASAGVTAAVYSLNRLFAPSGAAGTGFSTFNTLLGTSTKTLQQYQFAARQAGVTNEDVSSTFRSLQSAMTKTLIGEGAPQGLAMVARLTGQMSAEDLKKFQANPELLLQKLQEYAGKEQNLGLRNEVLKSFGLSDAMISAMAKNSFTQSNFAKAPTYSGREIESLNRANIAWTNLGVKIEMAIGHFNARHGGELVRDISLIIDKVIKLADAVLRLADKFKVFQIFGKYLDDWAKALDSIGNGANKVANSNFDKKIKSFTDVFTSTGISGDVSRNALFGGLIGMMTGKGALRGALLGAISQIGIDYLDPKKRADIDSYLNSKIAPDVAPKVSAPSGPSQSQQLSVQQHLHFQHDGRDHARLGDASKRGINAALRQMPAGGQGS